MPSYEPVFSFAALQNRLVIRGDLIALTAFRIGAGRSSSINSNDLPVLRDASGAPLVPGASLKGVFRARVEALIRAVRPEQALDLQAIEDKMRTNIGPLRENDAELERLIRANRAAQADQRFTQLVWDRSTLIDLTFGAPWLAGRIFFKDALVDPTLWFNQFEIRNGVGLNRDTETVDQRLLYDYEVVPAGVRFAFELVLENAAEWQLGMILLALRPWQNGDVQIGGFRSRGLGHVQLQVSHATFNSIGTPDDVLSLLGYGGEHDSTIELPLSRLPGLRPVPGHSIELLAATPEPLKSWFAAFKDALVDPRAAIEKGAQLHA